MESQQDDMHHKQTIKQLALLHRRHQLVPDSSINQLPLLSDWLTFINVQTMASIIALDIVSCLGA